jgi:hypothetical protein
MSWSSLDTFIFAWYCLFGFVALVFEPLYYFGCEWNGETCPLAETYPFIGHVRDIWAIYNQFDPMFFNVPRWLQVMCMIEVFIFGPLYLITAYGFYFRSSWLHAVALPFSGALIYSTIVYFAMEAWDLVPGTNMVVVFAVNLPWTIVPALLLFRLTYRSSDSHKKQV